MSNENSGNVLPSDYCCHLFDFAKLAKIYKFRFANSWFDSPMATWRTLTGTLAIFERYLSTIPDAPHAARYAAQLVGKVCQWPSQVEVLGDVDSPSRRSCAYIIARI